MISRIDWRCTKVIIAQVIIGGYEHVIVFNNNIIMANVVLGNVGNHYFCSTSWYWKNRLLTGSFDCQNEHSWLPVLQIVLRRCSESYCMILITVFSGLSELFYSGLLLTLIFAQYSMADKFTNTSGADPAAPQWPHPPSIASKCLLSTLSSQ